MLKIDGLTKNFAAFRALNIGEIEIPSGKIVGIVGPNGAGKTTMFNTIGGAIRPDGGNVYLDGQRITALPPHRLAALGLVRTFQISRDLGALTVLENLLVARPNQTGESLMKAMFFPGLVRQEESEAIKRAKILLKRVDLWRLADAPASDLSGGQKKLLEVLRAMMLSPKIILLDEPAAGVAPPMEEMLAELILDLKSEGTTFLIVEHDMEMIERLCDSIYVMTEGRELMHGTFKEVTSDQRVIDAYLGGAAI